MLLFIADGMGREYREMASLVRHGEPGKLAMDQLPVQRVHRTGNLSGVVDSAASATTIATGVATWNGAIGVGHDGRPRDGLTDVVHARTEGGERVMGLGLVSTAQLAHATPAAFIAHHPNRGDYPLIAAQMVVSEEADVMLGGGRMHFGDPRTEPPTGLLAHADAALVGSRGALLEAADAARAGAATPTRLWGVFDEDHLAWVADGPHPEIPSIAEMTESAIALLDARFGAWLLVVEGARIDHGGHGNDLRLALAETLAFDDALAAALRWADGRDDVSTFVVSDHETGGLEWRGEMPANAEPTLPPGAPLHTLRDADLPPHRWRNPAHSNDDVALLATGPCAEQLPEGPTDHGQLHDVLRGCISGQPAAPRARLPTVDGFVDDLDTPIAAGVELTLRARADEVGLSLGVAAPEGGWGDDPGGDWLFAIDFAPGQPEGVASLPHDAADVPAVHAVLRRAEGRFEGCRPDLIAAMPVAAFADANLYRRDVGAALLLADRAATALPMSWNLGSPAVGRGLQDADAGLEWMLPWRVLFPGGRPDDRLNMAVSVLRVAPGGTAHAVIPSAGEPGEGIRCAPLVVDGRSDLISVSAPPPT